MEEESSCGLMDRVMMGNLEIIILRGMGYTLGLTIESTKAIG